MASYEEDDSNAVAQEQPSTVVVMQDGSGQKQANGFHVEISGGDVATSNVASTMFA